MTTHAPALFKRVGNEPYIERTPRPAQPRWRRQDSDRINRMDDRELFDRIAAAMRRNGGGA
ncbi:MAG: hypothetical protein OXE02_02290 [Chloroflexi bacterium]|nr:hypothetical protein [Chloroflexota bacterium]